MNDPPALDLGAQEPHLAELYRILARCVGTYQSIALSPPDAAAWLQHVDALRADLAALETERDQYRQRANSAEARMGNYRADNRRLSEARVRVQQHNAGLMALEQAARAWAEAKWSLHSEGLPRVLADVQFRRLVLRDEREAALLDTIANLAAPPGEPS